MNYKHMPSCKPSPTHLKTPQDHHPIATHPTRAQKKKKTIMESSSTFETTASPVLLPKQTTTTKKKKKKKSSSQHDEHAQPWPRKKLGVTLEASYSTDQPPTSSAATTRGGPVVGGRRRSLTGEDLEELKGCLDLGFGFSYHEIPDLRSTLPALELCYSMSQTFLLDHHQNSPAHLSSPPPPVANWKFSSPGDDPEEVKARLKYWAQAVACTVKLCS
ncbi:uncharacterized protein M6B38_185280 [Iris pallida]|uniref:Uncharacterized protein n=1 Tax=Iris pallida TaxID=29817 RepID=A0AAX6ELW4_IRIPA|nr:uncharacterized protein M6B38_185280 [Iris pallida]